MIRFVCQTTSLAKLGGLMVRGSWENGTFVGLTVGQFFFGLAWRHDPKTRGGLRRDQGARDAMSAHLKYLRYLLRHK